MRTRLRIRDTRATELPMLTALALRAKGHWGHAPAVLERMRAELTWDVQALARCRFRCAEAPQTGLVGFSAVAFVDAEAAELEALFVDPPWIGMGHGRALLEDAVAIARASARRRMLIHSDPDAEGFYLQAGARRIGVVPSGSIAGRMLPLLELDLRADAP
ncbi:MAG TPA: GNAT family N-acetyltransferase [Pseudomonadales bacterium]|nr:GNAT family N-acetyltransferase [Pseudomonadales bacterium]